jgi:sarcosine oxidase gamma subunit
VNGFYFLEADPAHPTWRSPLTAALGDAPAAIRDVSAEAEDGPLGYAAGVAGIEVDGPLAETLLARLTDLEAPGVGSLANVRVELVVAGEDRFRIWFAQEYAEYLGRIVLDAWAGLG